ncbi:MAG: hypothetical protein ABFD18_09875 [Syntrophomonas sp.]
MAWRIGKHIFLGFVAGYLLAVLLGHWTWLAMRFNSSLLIPVLIIIMSVWGLRGRRDNIPKVYFLGLEIMVLLVFLLLYRDPSVLTVIPAIMFREAFGLSFLTLFQGNAIIILLMITGNLLWLLPGKGNFWQCYL